MAFICIILLSCEMEYLLLQGKSQEFAKGVHRCVCVETHIYQHLRDLE